MPADQIRNILIIALAFLTFMMWQAWQIDYAPRPPAGEAQGTAPAVPAAPPVSTGDQGGSTVTVPAPPATSGGETASDVPSIGQAPAPAAAPVTGAGAVPQQAEIASGDARVRVRTDVYELEINPVGATLDRLRLLRYPTTSERPDEPFALFSERLPDVFLAQTGFIGGAGAPSHHATFLTDAPSYELEEGKDTLQVVFRAPGQGGVQFEKVYTFTRDSYAIGLEFRVRNDGTQPWTGSAYGQFQRTQVAPEGGLFAIHTYTGGVLSGPDKPYEKIDFEDMANADLDVSYAHGWAAMIQHYFAGAFVPQQEQVSTYYTKALEGARYVLGVLTSPFTVGPGDTGAASMTLYAGPKIQDRLEAVAPNLDRTVDYGWLWFISQPLFWLLQHIEGVLGNWGWSIIALTLLIKLAFFHLSAASYKSMARMRKLQPRIMALRDRYQNDKQRMNQAMMELYRDEKINPLGGCLPILVQIPVFIALYWVLLESVELRQASFMFWLTDLSVHDPYFVLPALMGVTMLVQQKLNPAPPDPMQARIMMALPFVFTFLFLFFPAGLVLYWFVNNLLSIAQQWVITRKIVGTT